MSSIHKRKDSPYWQWKTYYKGRKLVKSTRQTQKSLAKKVQNKWDTMLIDDDLSFLGPKYSKNYKTDEFLLKYLKFIEINRTRNTFVITQGVLNRFNDYLKENKVYEIKEISVEDVELYLSCLDLSNKTKKNHLNIISLMLKKAMIWGNIEKNVTDFVDKPKIEEVIKFRNLEAEDLQIIFRDNGDWQLYFDFLYYTGLRAGDVARLKYSSIDFEKRQITTRIKKSRKIYRFPLADSLIEKLDSKEDPNEPIFPSLYSEHEVRLNHNISKPRKYMVALLNVYGQKKATLHSFRVTFNNIIRDMGYGIEDRQKLLAHATSNVTKIYTHPNEKLAKEIVNKIPHPMEVKEITVGYSVG